jgi:putative DNA primase/helicase
VIPFRQTFYAPEDGKLPVRDEHLKAILRQERPGILAWAVRGSLECQQAGLRPPKAVLDETASLFEAMDPLADWLEANCVFDPRMRTETGALWRDYVGWCEQEQRPWAFKSRDRLTRAVAQRDGVDYKRLYDGRYLFGVGLRSAGQIVLESQTL